MSAEHYRLPEGHNCVINFSGGRSSAYLLRQILDAYDDELPDHVLVAFTNTGKEREETLEFVHRIETHWCPVVWLEYDVNWEAAGGRKDPKHIHRVVDYDTASREGEPFEKLCLGRGFVPNPTMRLCTSDLKVKPLQRYLKRQLGWKKWKSVLGIRFDEKQRAAKAMLSEDCNTLYPMVHAGVTKREVLAYWAGHLLDLGIDSELGNCDLCFLKGRKKLMRLIAREPERADWWIRLENRISTERKGKFRQDLIKPELARFKRDYSYQDLLDWSKQLTEAEIQMAFAPDPEQIDCFCGFDE